MNSKLLYIALFFVFFSCKKDGGDEYNPTFIELEYPSNYPPPLLNPDNPLTKEGVALGKKLFFDPQLSGNNTMSCATCHNPDFAFTDNGKRFSTGIDGTVGDRNSMPLFNLAWNYTNRYFWDGRADGLENLVFEPIRDPREMKSDWITVVAKLKADKQYPDLFFKAFGIRKIDSVLVSKAIAQYLRTLISFGSKFDKFLSKEIDLTPQELKGLNLIMTEEGGDCFHCHTAADRLFGTHIMHNNGLDTDAQFKDFGFELVTGNPADRAKFKTPSLRNIMLTAPYMHDGRFATIDEVLMHYIEGGKPSSTVDPLMKHVGKGLDLSISDIEAIKAFLHTLTDSAFIFNPRHRM